jgi:branched-chain amino acid transport system permease protein
MQSKMLGILAMVALIFAPQYLPVYAMTLLTELVILALFAMSLDLMVGYTKLVSFGHAGAYGLGAYVWALLSLHTNIPLPFVIFLSALIVGIVAIGIAWSCTMATGVSFAMLTLAFGQLGYAVAIKWVSVTGGSDGLSGIPRRLGPFGWSVLTTKTGFYLFALACLFASYFFCRALIRAPFGQVLRGIRENEMKVLALGYNTRHYKIAVVSLAYLFAGMAGALYASFAGFANPEMLFWTVSGQVLIMVIVGGKGTLIGPMLGAVFFIMVEHKLSELTETWGLFMGIIFIGFVMFAPDGILGILNKKIFQRGTKQVSNQTSVSGNSAGGHSA